MLNILLIIYYLLFITYYLLIDYRQLKRIDDDKNMFTNQRFLDHLSVYSSESYNVLYNYKRNFEKIKFFIDQLFNCIIENELIIPYVVKCICKVIDELVILKVGYNSINNINIYINNFIIVP